MSEQIRSEIRKLRTTRTAAVLLLVAVAFALLGIFAPGFTDTPRALGQEETQRRLLGSAATNAVFFAAFVGVLVVTGEFRYGTIRPTLLFEPRRRVVLAAKLAAAALAGVLYAIVCVVVSFTAGLAVLAARDVDVALTGKHALTLVLGTVLASAFIAMLGVTIGALIRNQVGAIGALAAYIIAFESILFATVPAVGRYLPGESASAVAGLPSEDLLSPLAGAAVLAAWTMLFGALAAVRTDRSDV